MTGGCAVRAPGSLRGGRDRRTEWEGGHRQEALERVEKTGGKGRAVVRKGGKGGTGPARTARLEETMAGAIAMVAAEAVPLWAPF